MPVEAPFNVQTDELGNAVSASPEPVVEKKRGRKKRAEGRNFLVLSNEGAFVCSEAELQNTMTGKTDPEVYLLEKKVKELSIIPGKKNLLTGVSEKDTFEIVFE